MIGMLIGGKYRVERALGEGGMGAVWVAVQEPLGRRVALKVIRGTLDASARTRFEREAKIVASLRCPHVVTLFDFGEHEGAPYIVLELLDGETLRDKILRGPLTIDEALALARDIGCGLRSAHEMGVVHRDLKPENVVVVPDKDRGVRAKLLDFGIAKAVEGAYDGATAAGAIAGSVGYIAPEVILRGASSDVRADLYALGVILFEMITGASPFSALTPLAVIAAHATEPAPDVRTKQPAASAALASLIARMLQKDPAHRPRDGEAVVAEIDALRAGSAPTSAALQPIEHVFGKGVLSLPDRPSIAVQPFSSLGGSDDDRIFAEGISEDILMALSRFKHLFVVSLATMIEPGGRDTDPIRVGQRLGVRYVVQGNVRRSGERLRVSAKLVDVQCGSQLWTNRYDSEARELFDLQDEIVQSVASAVAGHAELAQGERARKMAPHTLAVYDWLARGRFFHHRRTLEDNERSRAALDRAVELDPEFAHGHAWRACAYGQALAMGVRSEEINARMTTSAQRALALDDTDAECHRLVCELSFVHGDIAKAEHHHRRAIALNPNDARIVGQAGELLTYIGDLEEAATMLKRAARLDPLSATPYLRLLTRARYVQGELDEAWRLYRCLDDHQVPFVALGAAIAALHGDDFVPLVAEVRANAPTWRLDRWTPPFVDPERRARWRRGYEAAGLL